MNEQVLLQARDPKNGTANDAKPSSPPPSSSPSQQQQPSSSVPNQIEETGSAAKGKNATIHADTLNGECVVQNKMDPNQQSSWNEEIVNTCCTGPKASTCWYRLQAKTAPEVACKIPNCEALNSNDPGAMLGFRPLSGTNGEGKYNNIYPILFLSGAARPAIPILLFLGAPLLVSLLVLL